MADLIDRDALLQDMTKRSDGISDWHVFDVINEQPAVNRLIPVEDALPDAFIYVICAGKDGMAILRYNGDVWVDDTGCIYPMSAITHWMPLPELPEKE